MKTIIGAGLAGLIAAHAWPNATVIEASKKPSANHRALLRFRCDSVSRLTGIEFKQVRVHKGIFGEQGFTAPSIQAANMYSRKVLGRIADRSIWNIDPVDRFIAPDSLYEQLVESVGNRIVWNERADFSRLTDCVTTAPLPVTMHALGIVAPEVAFERAPIFVKRWKLPRADVYQTIYYPGANTPLYRASITGDTLIAEYVDVGHESVELLEQSFGIDLSCAEQMEAVEQKYGKIAAIDDATRKQLLFRITHEHGLFSLGRFATWRNILLDDVVDDIAVIKRLARSGAAYDVRKIT